MRIRLKSVVLPAAAGIAAALFVTCFLGTMTVRGNAMEPSIPDGSIIFINKAAYFYQEPEPGDVVAFRCNVYSEDGEGSILVRRIAAVSGDRVRIADGVLLVNDKIYEGYSEKQIYLEPMDETVVGRDRIFVLSDSQTAVLDSRDSAVGQLRTDELIGKVCFR
jgi:signal peptidase I